MQRLQAAGSGSFIYREGWEGLLWLLPSVAMFGGLDVCMQAAWAIWPTPWTPCPTRLLHAVLLLTLADPSRLKASVDQAVKVCRAGCAVLVTLCHAVLCSALLTL